MFDNLKLYYLNQLGINPWVNKENTIKSSSPDHKNKASGAKLAIFTTPFLDIKAVSLLNKMIAYLSLPEHELIIINAEDKDQYLQLNKQLKINPPRVVLNLSANIDSISRDWDFTCPVLSNIDLNSLLINPLGKKEIFNDLEMIKNLIY